MESAAIAPYEAALHDRSGRGRGELSLQVDDGRVIELDLARWLDPADAADETVVARCVAPVLDVGCGPGRFLAALHERGVPALGVDIAEAAVLLTRGLGLPALLRNVFAELPGEGRWPTALLMDGNIGIGGDPERLLRRVRTLIAAYGRMIVETNPDDARFDLLSVRFTVSGRPVGPSFGWAEVGIGALSRCAESSGLAVVDDWTVDGRRFAVLASPDVSSCIARSPSNTSPEGVEQRLDQERRCDLGDEHRCA